MKEFMKEIDAVVENRDFGRLQELEGKIQDVINSGDFETAAQMYGTLARVYKLISDAPDTAIAADYYLSLIHI